MTGLTRRNFVRGAGAAALVPLGERLVFGAEPLKVAFLYLGPIGDFGWSWAHDHARQRMETEMAGRVRTSFAENVPEGAAAERVMREMAVRGNRLIFATSFGYMSQAMKVSQQFPQVYFEHATGYQRTRNLATYNARFYEGRAVLGTIAGHMSRSGVGGYVGSYPIPEVVMGINAFTLAAQKVNPDFRTRVTWVNSWLDPDREARATGELIDQGADVITQHTDSPAPLQIAQKRGVIGFGQAADMSSFAPDAHMTAIADNWAPYYVSRAQAVIDGVWQTGYTWWGLKEGAVSITPYNPAMPEKVVEAAEQVRMGIVDGTYDPFAGPISGQDGVRRVGAGETLDDSQLLTMDWYVQGVWQQ